MAFSPGSRIGPYEISGKLGEGGMGEVYRARDARLNRDVAVKALPASFATDPDRLGRFQREAQVLAALSHANIAAIYGLEDSSGSPALIMELVEGSTLAERIAAGPISIDEALAIARQLGDALEAAHEKGIVHRDLKPANIKLTPEGKVKVLDFGLAKALANEPPEGAAPGSSLTLTLESTRAGMILGSAGYMSPEQARGKPVDKRADIWAFGVILYEMLSGHVAFEGETVTDSLAAILRADIEWHRLPADTPPWVIRLLKRCLERDSKRRLRDIGDAWIESDAPAAVPAVVAAPPAPPRAYRWLPWAAALIVGGGGIASSMLRRTPEAPRPVVRSSYSQEKFFGLVAISRDGTRIAYGDTGANSPMQLTLRMEDQLNALPIPGGENAVFPFFSPDGDWIGYTSLIDGSKLRKIRISGGTPITLSDNAEIGGADWGDDDMIYFGGAAGLKRISAAGGIASQLTKVDSSKVESSHVFPHLLPGRNAVIFTILTHAAPRVAVLDLKSNGAPRILVENGTGGRYLPTGHLVYTRGGTLFAAPFDTSKLTITGPEVPVVDDVAGVNGKGDFDVSDTGTLLYMKGSEGSTGHTILAIADEKGAIQLISDEHAWGTGRISPDGKRFANDIHGTAVDTSDIWVGEVARKTGIRITFEGLNATPVWTRDGRRLYWGGVVGGKTGIFSAPSDGSGKPALVLETPARPSPGSLTADGRMLLYAVTPPSGQSEIWSVPLSATGEAGKPAPVRQSASSMETTPQLSPDGRRLAYVSTETGGREVYVQPFPGPGSKVRVSTQGGYNPRWSHDGRQLLYWGGVAANELTRVAVETSPSFRVGASETLFNMAAGSTWDTMPDGKHFLVEQLPGGGARKMITVVNWFEELKRRAPVKR
jgi:serine/threonine-protein kinase